MSDLIERQAAVDAVRSYYDESDEDEREIEERIADLPSVQERKKGKWTEKEVIHNVKNIIIEEWQSARCSICGKYHTTPYMYFFDNYNFCPNCGAEMRERGEDE